MNLRARQPVLQALGNTEIINPPPGILLACLKPVRPPGINSLFIRVKIAVRVDISRVQKLRKLASLLIRKSGIFRFVFGFSGQSPCVPHSDPHRK